MIKVEGLTKRYARHVAVDNISFEVAKGQIVGFLGPNGAGKTTTMRCIAGLEKPDSGAITINGRPMFVRLNSSCCLILGNSRLSIS